MTTKPKRRGLSKGFMTALISGFLKPLVDIVKADNTLDFQIREDYMNVYYRGGNLLRVGKSGSDFVGEFDLAGYEQSPKKGQPKFRFSLLTQDDVTLWIEQVPRFKYLMDRYITKHPHEEREVQQLIVRENNYGSQAKSTDYFICDIEFAQSNEKFRFDMIAAHWPSTARARKNTKNIGLAFVEVKYGDGALEGSAGIKKHLKDMKTLLDKFGSLKSVAQQMVIVFNQKIELGLIPSVNNEITSFNTNVKPVYIFILGNHHPRKSKLGNILGGIDEAKLPFELKFAVSNFMGFGLYEQTVYSLEEFKQRFKKGIHSK